MNGANGKQAQKNGRRTYRSKEEAAQARGGQGSLNGLIDKQPPMDLTAEVGVIGSVFLLPTVFDDIVAILKPEHFYDDANRTIYSAMLHFHEHGKKCDDVLLVNYLKQHDQYETIGGAAYLAKVVNAVPNAAHAVHYAQIVQEKAIYRNLITSSTEILRDSYDELYPALDMVTMSDAKFAKIAEDALINSEAVSLHTVVHEALEQLDAKMSGASTGLKTGIHGFDEICRLRGGELIILAARPSMGKSALAANIADYVANHTPDDSVTLFVSLEMNRMELVNRMLSSKASVDLRRMNDGSVTPSDRQAIIDTSGDMSQLPIQIDDNSMQTVSKIAAQARRIKRKTGLALIIIDYLQLIEPDNSGDSRQEQIAKITRRLKLLARELNVPIMALAQLNRQTETTKDNRPRLAHLRESGAIEQDADIVMFCHRQSYYDKQPTASSGWTGTQAEWETSAEVILAKARNAPTKDIPMIWRKEFVRFDNPAQQHHEHYANAGNAGLPPEGAPFLPGSDSEGGF